MNRALVACVVAVCVAHGSIAAQDAARTWPPWRTSYFPYLEASPNDGVVAVARLVRFRQAAYDDRVSLRSSIGIDAGYSTRGTAFARARADFPRIADGWRVAAFAGASQEKHLGDPDGDLARRRINGWIDVTRAVSGTVHAALRLSGDDSRFEADPSLLNRYPRSPIDQCLIPGLPCSGFALSQTDFQARAALVVDLRDREFDTRRGILAEAGVMVGGAGEGYTGGYALAKGWLTPRPGTRLTARAAARAVSETGAAAVLSEIPAWEQPIATLGGMNSHRGLGEEALVGRGVLLAGAEARHDLMNFGNIGAVTLLGFVDAGRVFADLSPLVDPEPGMPIPSGGLEFTLKGWTVGAGGGVSLRLLRNAQLTATVGRANERTSLYISAGTSW